MKTSKAVTDNTAAYMNKGVTNNAAQNGPKGTTFEASQTSKAPMVGVGMSQHKRSAKGGNRHSAPNEHLTPTASTFHKIGR